MRLKIGSLLSMLMVALIATSAFASKPNDGKRAEKIWQDAVTKLQLTAEQQTKLKPLFDAQGQQMKTRHEQHRSQFLSILTDAQKAQVEKMEADRKAARQAHEKYDPKAAFKSLNLTDEQKAQMKTMRQASMEQMKAQRQQFVSQVEAVLTPEQKTTFEQMMTRHGEHKPHSKKPSPDQK